MLVKFSFSELLIKCFWFLVKKRKDQNCKHAWTNLTETEIDLIEVNLGQSIAEIPSNYRRANIQEKSRFTFHLQ